MGLDGSIGSNRLKSRILLATGATKYSRSKKNVPYRHRNKQIKGLVWATLGDFGVPRSSEFQVEPILQAARVSCGWCFSVGDPDLPEVQSWAVVDVFIKR